LLGAAGALSRHLDELAITLDEQERAMLGHILFRAADPLTRAAVLGYTDLFSPEEQALVRALLGEN
jgi:hypothetical protein